MKIENKISYVSPHILAHLPKDTPVLVAFSGGADSSALLHILTEDAKFHGYVLHAAHFNHQIRGDEAERDAKFCRSVCEKLNIPFHLGSADIPLLARDSGNSIEAEARERRYNFFAKIMRENGIRILVTAHHAEDQIESVMLHILRGSSVSGLCGISPCRIFADDLLLVRPLLNTEKEDILSYCEKNNVEFVTDSTNSDISYARNFIRAELSPKMRELQPNLTKIFQRLSENATEADDFIESSAKAFISKCENGIPLSKLNELHPALKSRVIALTFDEYSGGASLEHTHIKSIIELVSKAQPHSSISLPNKVAAKIENGRLVFSEDNKEYTDGFILSFTTGILPLPNGVTITVEINPTNNPLNSDVFLDVNCDMLNHSAHFRSKNDGDTIFTGKMNKKVKKLLNEKKVPLNLRKKLPLLICENEILWIPTVAVCDSIKRDKIKDGKDFYRITVKFEI